MDKLLSIQTLQPWIKNGWILFRRNMRELLTQLMHYPMGDHDDGPDALEMLKSMIEAGLISAVSVSAETSDDDYHAARPGGRINRLNSLSRSNRSRGLYSRRAA